MELLDVNPQRDYLQQLILDDVLKHLRTETDNAVKLRIALLLAINLLQQEDEVIATDFCNTMLGEFSPLADAFSEDHTHPLCGGYKVLRAKDENENLKVLIPKEYIEYVAGPYLDRSDEK